MSLDIHPYVRKPFTINACLVTLQNMDEVAKWCDGQIGSIDGKPTIKVPVKRPLSVKQTIANVGDWVLESDSGYKVYTDSSFQKTFDKADSVDLNIVDIMNVAAWLMKQIRTAI